MVTKYINTWKLKRWQSNLLYTLLGLVYSTKIVKGDKIRCYGIGYPHWKDEIRPQYVLDMEKAIQKSRNIFFKGVFSS